MNGTKQRPDFAIRRHWAFWLEDLIKHTHVYWRFYSVAMANNTCEVRR